VHAHVRRLYSARHAHQVAWLLSEFPFGDPTHRVILRILGMRFNFDGGCSMESITAVISALHTLAA
jgi:hypothetical protein